MTLKRNDPPWDYLSNASPTSLQSFELSRLNHAANLRREIGVLLDQWLDETAQALLARWLLENPQLLRQAPLATALNGSGVEMDEPEALPELPAPVIRPKLVRQVKPRVRVAGQRG
jgi:hypothetical protein